MDYKKENIITILTVVMVANLVALAWFGWDSYSSNRDSQVTEERQMKVEELRGIIIHLDEVLTMSARMAAATGDLKWEERYREFEPKLDAAIKEVMALWPEAYRGEAAAKTNIANLKLVEMENRAFDLVRQGHMNKAHEILFSDEYEDQKRIYAQGMISFTRPLHFHDRLAELRSVIVHLDEVLTMSARMAAATGDLKWEERYREVEPELDAAIKEAVLLSPQAYNGEAAAKTNSANFMLVEMEKRAFDLIRQGNPDSALSMLFGNEYEQQKRVYSDGIADFKAIISEVVISDMEVEAHATSMKTTIVFLLSPLLVFIWIIVFRAIRRWRKHLIHHNHMLAQQADELAALNMNLDQKVAERTRELEDSQQVAIKARQETENANKTLTAEVTERKRAEEKYSSLFKNMLNGFALHEIVLNDKDEPVDYIFLEVNDAFEQLTTLCREDIIGKTVSQVLPGIEKDPNDWIGRYGKVALERKEIRFEQYSAPLKKWYSILAFCPKKGYFAVVFEDITDRKQAEEALCESEEKYRNIAEHIYDVVMVVNLDGVVLYVSPSVRRAFGYISEELVGENILDIIPEAAIPHAVEAFQLSATGKNVEGHHSEILKKDGSYASIELNAVPIYINDKIIGAQAVIRDITETKHLRELASRAERLELAGTIAGEVAHDFNNLLAPIMAYPEIIRDELPLDHKAHAFLDDIGKSAEKIAQINQDLLTLGRRGHYSQDVINLNRIVLQAAREMESRTKTVTCEMNLCEDLMNIKGGEAQIHRTLTNLLVNARDAMQNMGQVTIKTENYYADDTSVAFGIVPKGEYIKLTISDSGCGIPDDIIQKILDPFFSTKTANKKCGSGLGLSVVDAVMKDHNGYLDLRSKVGHGTSFYLYFPVTREKVGEDKIEQVTGGTETVLIIDDDSIQREVSSLLLKRLGYNVITVESGEKAIEFLRENTVGILILDMIMPGGIDGAETYRRIIEISPHQKAIILSGLSESDQVFYAQKLGAGAFVRKPVTKKAIAAAVRMELDRHVEVTIS